jgi:amino acid adenylation domain-containing protein
MDIIKEIHFHNATLVTAFLKLKDEQKRGITYIEGKEDVFVTYQQLYAQALSTLQRLQEQGLCQSDKLIFQIQDNRQFIRYFWACLLGGICPVPVTVGDEAEHKVKVFKIWKNLGQPFIVGREKNLNALANYITANSPEFQTAIQSKLVADDDQRVDSKAQPHLPPVEIEDLAYLQFSSGSTGDPKGVVLTHKNLVSNVHDIIDRSGVTQHDSLLSWMPLTHDMGLICFHLCGIISQANQYLMPPSLFVRNPLLWLDKASEYRSSLLYSPNFGYEYLLSSLDRSSPAWDLSAVRNIYNGAEHISKQLCEAFIAKLTPFGLRANAIGAGYGLAEASVAVCLPNVGEPMVAYNLSRRSLNTGDKIQVLNDGDLQGITFVEVGFPVRSCQVRICGHQNERVPEAHVGNIQIKGANVTKGYYNNPAATKAVFTEDGWLNTGDLGFLRNGRLVIIGRSKNIIIINGQNYYPQDIEKICEDVVGVSSGKIAACSHINYNSGKEQFLLFVAYKGSLESFCTIASEVTHRMSRRLGLIPEVIVPVKKIPRTTSGKKQYFRLKEDYEAGNFDSTIAKLNALLQAKENTSRQHVRADHLLGIIHTLTGAAIDPSSNLLEVGLNSLKAVQLISEIKKTFGVEISLQELFSGDFTVDTIVEIVTSRKAKETIAVSNAVTAGQFNLTSSQKRLWSIHYSRANSTAANLAFNFTIEGSILPDRFSKALLTVISQHEALRMNFSSDNHDIPHQMVRLSKDYESVFSFADLRLEPNRTKTSARILTEECNHVFDLKRNPLIKVKLISLHSEQYILSIVLHHIIADGWSVNNFIHELFSAYETILCGEDITPSGAFGYTDYLQWRAINEESNAFQSNLDYWRGELSGPLSFVELNKYRERSPIPSFKGKSVKFRVNRRVAKMLKKVSMARGATPYMAFMTLFCMVLYRLTRNSEILLATEVAGRSSNDWNKAFGHFINTVFLKTTIDRADNFDSVLEKVKKKALKAFDHQFYSFEQLTEELGWSPDFSSRLFNVLVTFQNFDHIFDFHGLQTLRVSSWRNPSTSCLVDLHIDVIEFSDYFEITTHYNTDIYKGSTIKRFVKGLRQFLSGVVADQVTAVHKFSLVSESDKKLLQSYSSPDLKPRPHVSICDVIKRQSLEAPGAIALCFGNSVLSYGALQDQSSAIADFIHRQYDILKGDRVILFMKRSECLVLTFLGILKSGAIVVPIDLETPAIRVQTIIEEAQPKCLITDTPSKIFDSNVALLNFDDIPLNSQTNFAATESRLSIQGSDSAYIMFTSGTSGIPKGVLISHDSLLDYALTFSEYFKMSSTDVVVQQASVAFDTFIEEVFPALLKGAQVVILKEGGRNIDKLIQCINSSGVTILSTTPFVLNELNARAEEIKSFPLIISGGDVLKSSYVSNLIGRTKLYNTYGPTESTVCALYNPVRTQEDVTMVGTPISNRSVYILDEAQQLVSPGEVGEVCIAGKGTALGYLNRPEESHEKFVADPFFSGRKMYRTGDLGRWHKTGKIEFLGRRDSQVKIRGYRVELGEIENVLLRFKDIHEAVVLVRGEGVESILVAFCVRKHYFPQEELRLHVTRFLPHYMVPAELVYVDALPINSNGKIDRKMLLGVPGSKFVKPRIQPPRTATEHSLVPIWKEILGLEDVGVDDNFFALGGHSLKAMKMLSRLRKEFSVDLELYDIYEQATISAVATLIETAKQVPPVDIFSIEEQDHYAVSHGQKRMWILDQVEENQIAYNIPIQYFIEGSINKRAFIQAFEMLVDRHEILRTTFTSVGSVLRQRIAFSQTSSFEAAYIDMRTSDDPMASGLQVAREEAAQPFDLANGPLLRVKLIQLDDLRYIFLFTVHHIISDGWSVEILRKELHEVYSCLADGTAVTQKALRIQYKDYAAWQIQELNSERLVTSRNYWLSQFSGSIARIELPADRIRPAIQTFRGASYTHCLARPLTVKISDLARKEGVTVFVTLLSALKTLFFRYTLQTDIILGTPVAGREYLALNNQVGLYMNLLPLRNRLHGGLSFRRLLLDVKSTTLLAQQHQLYPFDRLIDDLNLPRDISRSPLFDIVFIFNTDSTSEEFPLFKSERAWPCGQGLITSQFDLTITISVQADQFEIAVQYNIDLYDEWRIKNLVAHYENILKAVVNNVEIELRDIDFLSAREKVELADNVDNRDVGNSPNDTVITWFERCVNAHPDKIALVSEDRIFTYDQLNREANKMARGLCLRGIRSGDIVALMLNRTEKMVIAMLAIIKANASYLPLNPAHPDERIIHILRDSAAHAVVVSAAFVARISTAFPAILVIDADQHQDRSGDDNLHVSADASDWMYLLYTSGSTGKPKGVGVPHGAVLNLLDSMSNAPGIQSDDRLLGVSNYTFDISVLEIFLPLINGATIVVISDRDEMNFEEVKNLIDVHNISLMQATPSLWSGLVNSQWKGKNDLKMLCGGEMLPVRLARALMEKGGELWNMYGPTETTIWSTFEQVSAAAEVITVGRPVQNTQVLVLDQFRNLVPAGVPGEVCIGGMGLSAGYVNQSDLTAMKFISHPYRKNERLFCTGDIGRWTCEQKLEFLGRNDSQVKVRGYRVELGEIEQAIVSYSRVTEAVVLCRADANADNELICFVNKETNINDLKAHLAGKLPAYMIPTKFVAMDKFPLNASGKIDRKALMDLKTSPVAHQHAVPQSETERRMLAIWSEVLERTDIGIDSNFFEAGGHSLKGIRLSAKLQKAFDSHVSLKDIFIRPTVKAMAAWLASSAFKNKRSITPLEEQDHYPVSSGQKRLWVFDRLEQSKGLYNISVAYQLNGEVNHHALECAFQFLIKRHESLRTSFQIIAGEPRQHVRSPDHVDFVLEYMDLRLTDASDEDCLRIAAEEGLKVFNLQQQPLLRARLMERGRNSYVFLLTMAHMISDGWSMDVLTKEVLEYYRMLTNGNDPKPEPLILHYKDFSSWQKRALETGQFKIQKEFWLDTLASQRTPLEIPTDFTRPSIRSYEGNHVSFVLDGALFRALNDFSTHQEVTLHNVLVAAINVLLYSYSHQVDIVIGIAVASRDLPELENQIGFYVDTVPLRTQLQENETFLSVLEKTTLVFVHAYANKEYPFDKIVEDLKVVRSPNRSPVFDILVTYNRIESNVVINAGVEAKQLPLVLPISKFDISFSIFHRKEGVEFVVCFSRELFEEQRILLLKAKLLTLLEGITKDPFITLKSLSSLMDRQFADPSQEIVYELSI